MIKYGLLVENMRSAVRAATPGGTRNEFLFSSNEGREGCRKSNPKPWWNQECSDVINERKWKLALFRKTGAMSDYISFKKARAIARKTLNSKRKLHFVNFIQSINKFTSYTYVWNKVKILRHPSRTLQWNKWQGKSRREVIISTIDSISPCWVQERCIKVTIRERHTLDRDFSLEELVRAIECIKKYSASGIDNIEYNMIKLLPLEFLPIILDLFNEFFSCNDILDEWR